MSWTRGRMIAGMCKNPQVDMDGPAVAELVADVAAAVSRQVAAVSDRFMT